MPTIKHREPFVIRSYEVDGTGKVTLPCIADYFQEAAGKNAHDLHFDISDLQEKGATWVLFRLHIKIETFPERWQHVSVNTWPSSGDGIRAFRDYELVDESGERLGVGVSQWMVLNMENRRPMRMPKEILEMGLDVDKHMLPVDKDPFGTIDRPDIEKEISVSRYDFDMNNHVNNVKYIEWMTGHLPESLTKGLICREIKIQYHREVSETGTVHMTAESKGETEILHRITDNNGDLLAEGLSRWSG
ncbi:acyl-[acyl-carrier-protein] thioesterase [Rhodohalobacter sp. SW132]|uniref:acyl-[acyl-carrier-protein] thioesterase n=1 Tax=Rhodohalobacter sp. SW132 TaxID=2293433 RepID=UPI000E23A70B|nr:acyl-ACP thioesterase domain-containing protein [Rhodohalobacter sp. SW132]REL37686.1 acyl-[acyl-carrier-protein] thioesterase [Rhodohalobacter sp. SW132]